MRCAGTVRPIFCTTESLSSPPRPETAGAQVGAVAGFLPGQQPFLKVRKQVWNKGESRASKRLAYQGFRRVSYV